MTTTQMNTIDDAAELSRLADYVSGAMSAAEAEQFENELRSDREFFERMEPLLDVFYSREPLPEIQAEIDAMREEVATIKEQRAARAQLWKHLSAAAASFFSIKALGVLATAGIVVAIAWPTPSRTDDAPNRFFVHHAPRPERTQVAAVPKTRPHRRSPVTAQQPTEVATTSLPALDSAGARRADSLMKAIGASSTAVAGTTVALAEPRALPKTAPQTVWVRDDEVAKPTTKSIASEAGSLGLAILKSPLTLWKKLHGGGDK